MALQINYTDRNGRLNGDAYVNIGFTFGRKVPELIDIYIYASQQAYQNGAEPIDGKQRFIIEEADKQTFFSIAKQQELGNDLTKLGYDFLKSAERVSILPINFSEAQDI